MANRIDGLMQVDILTLAPQTPIRSAVAQLVETRQDVLPVIDAGGALVGVLTRKDCFRPALNASYYQQWSDTVADHMSRDVTTLDAATDLVAAAETFLASQFRAFPVTEGDRLVGLLDRRDVLRAFLALG